jgi:predicted amidophosphoribosyltransferase
MPSLIRPHEQKISFLHICNNCQESYDQDTYIETCPRCKQQFQKVLEHIVYPVSGEKHLHVCFDCNLQFDNDKREDNCPRCDKPIKYKGWQVHYSGKAPSFFEKISLALKNIFK